MKEITRERKNAKRLLEGVSGGEWLKGQMVQIITQGKRAFDECAIKVGRMLAESFLYMEREELAGPDYHPNDRRLKKWASQAGSVFIGGHKVKVEHPRLRGPEGERRLSSYAMLQDPTQFSEELLTKTLRGLSGRKYRPLWSLWGWICRARSGTLDFGRGRPRTMRFAGLSCRTWRAED